MKPWPLLGSHNGTDRFQTLVSVIKSWEKETRPFQELFWPLREDLSGQTRQHPPNDLLPQNLHDLTRLKYLQLFKSIYLMKASVVAVMFSGSRRTGFKCPLSDSSSLDATGQVTFSQPSLLLRFFFFFLRIREREKMKYLFLVLIVEISVV